MRELESTTTTSEYPKLADPEATLNPRTLNAYRHGLTGQIVLFTPEDEAAYKKHCAGVHESLKPVGYMETDLVQTIADDRWRLKRGASIEASIFACGISCPDTIDINNEEVAVSVSQGQTWVRNNKELLNITLYCQRIQRSIEKNIELVRQYQAERKAAQDQLVETFENMIEQAELKGRTFNAEKDFPTEFLDQRFAFSLPEIHRRAQWRRRYKHVKTLRLAA